MKLPNWDRLIGMRWAAMMDEWGEPKFMSAEKYNVKCTCHHPLREHTSPDANPGLCLMAGCPCRKYFGPLAAAKKEEEPDNPWGFGFAV